MSASEFHFQAIGVVRSPFKDKFGIPRQPGLAASARGFVKLGSDPDLRTALRSLDSFSHLWIVFVFHEHGGRKWKPSIRPPRLGGATKVGVLASRSPHRPNPIGISAVAIERVDLDAVGGPEIHVAGLDLLDGTPVLDIKPYIPYADSLPDASAGWASAPITRFAVSFTPDADREMASFGSDAVSLRQMIVDVLELDPRPAYQKRQLPVAGGAAGEVDKAEDDGGATRAREPRLDARAEDLVSAPKSEHETTSLFAGRADKMLEGEAPMLDGRATTSPASAKFGIEIANHEVKYEIHGGGFLVTSVSRR